MTYHHLNCTYIMPSPQRAITIRMPKEFRERTHGCWCASWKEISPGKYQVYRNGKWTEPKKGEVRQSRREPNT